MKKDYDFLEGEVLLFNKPLNWTSFQLVNKVRGLIKRKIKVKKIKVGHAGTLDPLASGLMILCTGKKTKEIYNHQDQNKEYIATIKLGATTPSFDGETSENYFFPTQHLTENLIESVVMSFLGHSEQFPPIFSAVKVKGKKLYESARKGQMVKIRSRSIYIQELEILRIEMPYIVIRTLCSKGTYIRSLANDIGRSLNNGAWLYKLQRTKIGDHNLNNSFDVHEFVECIKSI